MSHVHTTGILDPSAGCHGEEPVYSVSTIIKMEECVFVLVTFQVPISSPF